MALSESPFQQAWREFDSETCPNCAGKKPKHNAFCRHCYFSLPKEMQKALWRRFGSGFEEAYDDAKDWLKQEARAGGAANGE